MKNRFAWIAAVAVSTTLLLFAATAFSNDYELRNVRVVDGDTIRATVVLDFGIELSDTRIRLLGFDAWESSRARRAIEISDEEIEKGKIAGEALKKLLGRGVSFGRTGKGKARDHYGRPMLYLLIRDESDSVLHVDEWMKANGHTRR